MGQRRLGNNETRVVETAHDLVENPYLLHKRSSLVLQEVAQYPTRTFNISNKFSIANSRRILAGGELMTYSRGALVYLSANIRLAHAAGQQDDGNKHDGTKHGVTLLRKDIGVSSD